METLFIRWIHPGLFRFSPTNKHLSNLIRGFIKDPTVDHLPVQTGADKVEPWSFKFPSYVISLLW